MYWLRRSAGASGRCRKEAVEDSGSRGGVVVALVAGGLYYYYVRSRPAAPLTEKDTIVLADFVNTTGDAVFDDALKQALAVRSRTVAFS